MTYKNAPVSEVIVGLAYNKQKYTTDQIFALNSIFEDSFPLLEILPPLFTDELVGYKLNKKTDPSVSGPFLIRRRSKDNKWLLQLQSDRIYLNWIRNDQEKVGHYIGYSAIMDKYIEILKSIDDHTGISPLTDISGLDLTYHDRIDWRDYVSELSQVSEIINFSTPPIYSEEGYNNIFNRYTFLDSETNGFGIVNINTATSLIGNQIIKVEINLRGKMITDEISDWFTASHKKQLYIFETIFTDKIKEKWL